MRRNSHGSQEIEPDVAALMERLRRVRSASRAEGLSNTILEAMAVGLPVVATAVGGNCVLVQDGSRGARNSPVTMTTCRDALHAYLIRPHDRLAWAQRSPGGN